MRALRRAALLGALLATPLQAQRGGQVDVVLPAAARLTEGPSVSAARLLRDKQMSDLIQNGFPAALRFRVELWRKGGLFDDLEDEIAWDVYVTYDPYEKAYKVVRTAGQQADNMGDFPTLADAEDAAERAYKVPLHPERAGKKYYYNVMLEVETLSLSDLDELQRWLRGELRPAVRGKGNPATALGRGIGTLMSRVLGGEKRHYERQSPTFEAAP